ncbi:MAG: hypothetical protein RBQ81_03460 [Arcobacteraceae bacterium]|nr:hypothetical protein [Arcobacteraceae bacterium]
MPIIFTGCISTITNNKQMILEDPDQVKLRSFQTRTYEDISKETIMRACIAALQDLSFVIDRADMPTGTITATKYHTGQFMRFSITVRESLKTESNSILVRANGQHNKSGFTEPMEEPEPYRIFFTTVDKSLFLENK